MSRFIVYAHIKYTYNATRLYKIGSADYTDIGTSMFYELKCTALDFFYTVPKDFSIVKNIFTDS